MKVETLSRKWIKPSTPTPNNLKTYKLSSMDELNTPMNVVGILYYPFNENMEVHLHKLEISLAKILQQFYPFAGRYVKEKRIIDCSDQGAEYVEARVLDCDLDEIIWKAEKINDLLPFEVIVADRVTDPILSVQITKFKCGGVSIGICISHRIIDACSFGMFIHAWANATRGDHRLPINFDSSLYFPVQNYSVNIAAAATTPPPASTVTKRILFDRKAIENLRDRVRASYVNHQRPPSRVMVVSSFLAEALLRSDQRKHGGQPRPCVIMQEVNIRERTIPPISKYSCGNLVLLTTVECSAQESETVDFERFVPLLRNNAKKAVLDCADILSERHKLVDCYKGAFKKLKEKEVKGLRFTDWSKFEFYEADFGFGKPSWTSSANIPIRNLVILMNTKENDGIEAWVHLDATDMDYFQQDEEIKKLCSLTT